MKRYYLFLLLSVVSSSMLTFSLMAELPASLLDVQFNQDGTATDLSGKEFNVQKFGSPTIYWNETFNRNVAKFLPSVANIGVSTTDYFKVDYSDDADFQDKLADGHTLEVLCMFQLDGETHDDREIKPFASHEAGGTGFLLTNNSRNKCLIFLVNNGGWSFMDSEIYPEDGKYFHVVGVWDKATQTSKTYINGVLKATVATSDTYQPSTQKWFCVGGDAASDAAGNAWRGDVVIARVYDNPLNEEDAGELWNLVKDQTSAANTPTSLKNPSSTALSVYPNPAGEVVNIDLTAIQGAVTVEIFTVHGVKVIEQTVAGGGVQSISLAGLAPSVYIIKINGSASRLVVK
jgi:hypothetical protein